MAPSQFMTTSLQVPTNQSDPSVNLPHPPFLLLHPRNSLPFTHLFSPPSSSTCKIDPPALNTSNLTPQGPLIFTDGNPLHQAIIALYNNITTTETGDETAPQPATPVDKFDQYGILTAQLALVAADRAFLNALLWKKVSCLPTFLYLTQPRLGAKHPHLGGSPEAGIPSICIDGVFSRLAILQCDAES